MKTLSYLRYCTPLIVITMVMFVFVTTGVSKFNRIKKSTMAVDSVFAQNDVLKKEVKKAHKETEVAKKAIGLVDSITVKDQNNMRTDTVLVRIVGIKNNKIIKLNIHDVSRIEKAVTNALVEDHAIDDKKKRPYRRKRLPIVEDDFLSRELISFCLGTDWLKISSDSHQNEGDRE